MFYKSCIDDKDPFPVYTQLNAVYRKIVDFFLIHNETVLP